MPGDEGGDVCWGGDLPAGDTGQETDCSCQVCPYLMFQALSSDHGSWTCLLTYNNDYDTVRTYVDLQVAVKPQVSIGLEIAGETRDVFEDSDTVSIDLIVGEEKNFSCVAANGFPRSEIFWTMEKTSSPSLVQGSGQSQLQLSPDTYTMNTTYMITLHATMNYHNTTLTCHVTQYTSTGTVQHTASVSIILLVHHLFLPAPIHQEHLDLALPLLLFLLAAILILIGKAKKC